MGRRSVLTIGNFDGVHLGHQAILDRARQIAEARGAQVIALSFDPHPAAVLRPGTEPPRLMSVRQRVDALTAAGADHVHLLRVDDAFLAQSAEQFVDRLVGEFAPAAVVEGPDFRFGRGREGDLAMLRELGRRKGFEVVSVPAVEAVLHDRTVVRVSSSLARWLVGRGRVADAAVGLGRPFELTATVARGEQRGRTIGIPTLNLDASELAGRIIPADGVYAGDAVLGGRDAGFGEAERPAAISVGMKPTFGGVALTVEAHLPGWSPPAGQEAYGRPVTLRFARWLRDQYPFPSKEHLVAQLRRDIRRIEQRPGLSRPSFCSGAGLGRSETGLNT